MSVKRQATTDLNHDNWDKEEEDQEEMGSFKVAPKDVLEKRVIRTAKRRSQNTGDEIKKPAFSGFSGFNKSQPSSYDFLANLTNGGKVSAPPTLDKPTPNITGNSLPNMQLGSSIFSNSISSTPVSTFGGSPSEKAVFGITTDKQPKIQSIFTASKADSTVNDNPFKIQGSSNVTSNIFTTVSSNLTAKPLDSSNAQVSSTMFGAPSTSTINNKSLFSVNNSTSLQAQPVSHVSPQPNISGGGKYDSKNNDDKIDKTEVEKDKKMIYYVKLKGLNESVSEWIKKHVDETPLCILTPIFKDYERYLEEIQNEYESNNEETVKTLPAVSNSNLGSLVANKDASNSKTPMFGAQNTYGEKVSNFSFGINPSSSSTPTTGGFSFGIKSTQSITPTKSSFAIETSTANTVTPPFAIKTSNVSPTTPLFAIKTSNANTITSPFAVNNSSANSTTSLFTVNTSIANTSTSPFAANALGTNSDNKGTFSFGMGKPFTFNSNVQTNTTSENVSENNEEKEEEPPKVEFTQVVEENSIYDKRCKVFVKKDDNFVDKGVGTLYIKKIEESGKHQLLVRANTNLGNVMLNLILNSAIPIQRMGKNNVMMVCIPSPEAKPPPVPILIRVKTSEEADELLDTLNKYKI